VLSILIVNINNLGPSAFDDVYKAVGLNTVSYAPPNSVTEAANWPTLGSMIDAGTQLVTFLDNGANTAVVPYLIDEFTNIWETRFDVTNDTTFDCSVNRSKGDSSTEMYLINHFLDTVVVFGEPSPDIAALAQTNGVSGTNSLGAQVDICLATQGRPPNFLLVDYYEFGAGSVFEVAATINGVNYSPATPIASPGSTASVTSTPLNGGSFLDHNQVFACAVSVMAVMFGMQLVL